MNIRRTFSAPRRARAAVALLTLGAAAALARPASAAVTFAYVTDQSAYSIAPSASVNVSVFLRETTDGGSTSFLASQRGVIGFDVQLTRTGGAATITAMDANVEQFTQYASDPEPALRPSVAYGLTPVPDPPGPTPEPVSTYFAVSALDDPGAAGTPSGGTRTIFLGLFTVRAAANPGDASTFSVSDWLGASSTVTNGDLAASPPTPSMTLDEMIAGTQFTVSAIPEPTAFALPALAAGYLIRRSRTASCEGTKLSRRG